MEWKSSLASSNAATYNAVESPGDQEEHDLPKETCRERVLCPVDGCGALVIGLSRHLQGHGWKSEDSRKARGIFNLRKERSDKHKGICKFNTGDLSFPRPYVFFSYWTTIVDWKS